jgi:5-methylcytosine-specific restriction endonuclease McrBC regulatory subunit McrC
VNLQIKNTNNEKGEVRFKQLIRNPCVHNRLFNANFEGKLNEHPISSRTLEEVIDILQQKETREKTE